MVNSLCTQPGRNRVPLNYSVCDNAAAQINNNTQFIADYVDQAPLTGPKFEANSEEVHTYITNFIVDNPIAASKIQAITAQRNGHHDFHFLCEHYEGVCINVTAIVKAKNDVTNFP